MAILGSGDILAAATTWANANCSLIPIRADGTKRPAVEWHSYMLQPPLREEIFNWFKSGAAGIGVVCGKVSGNLEMLELEGRATSSGDIDAIAWQCKARGVDALFYSLMTDGYAEWTPSGGLHFLYRIADHEVPGNTKVARRPATEEEIAEDMAASGLPYEKINKIKVLSETRGEGGYVVVAPSGGEVHPTGDSWSVCAGDLGVIPEITWEQRQKLVEAIHAALDQMPPPTPAPARPKAAELLSGRPGDDFNNKATWNDILEPHGWTISHHQGNTTYWVRPGKDRKEGHSATTGHSPTGDRLYVFTSATEFEPETPYTKFAAYTLLEHDGNYASAARTLRAAGHGDAALPATPYVASPIPAPAPAALVPAASDAAVVVQEQATEVAPWLNDFAPPVISDGKILAAKAGCRAMSELYVHAYHNSFKYINEIKKWRYFNGKVWTVDRIDAHEQAAIQLFDRAEAAAERHRNAEWIKWTQRASRQSSPEGLMRWARSHPLISATVERFDARRHMITVDNGTIDLDTHTFTASHDPQLMLTKQLHITYDKDAEAPQWMRLLETLLPDPDIRGYLQRAVGHTLLGDAQERALFLLHGDPGSGKSQVVKVLQLLFGDYSQTAQATTFNDQSKRATITNDLNDLRGSRFVSVAELEEGERLNESLVKRLTGGDTAKSRGLYQENVEWEVQFTLWMATNFLPRLNSDDAAMWKRVKPIHFPVVVSSQGKEIKKYGEKIFAEEASGILNWLLDGVRMYQEQGLDDLPQITDAVSAYRRDVDTVAQFVDASVDEHQLVVQDAMTIGCRQLHLIYQRWCADNGAKPLGERRFGQRMQSLGFERFKRESNNVWLGIGQVQGAWMLGSPMRHDLSVMRE